MPTAAPNQPSPERPLGRAAQRWLCVALALAGALLVVKAVLAKRLSLFGDEAFYWWESRHLAWAYSDLPGLTHALIRLSAALGFDGYVGVRAVTVVGGVLISLLMVAIARSLGARGGALIGAAIGLYLLPIGAGLGLLALPDTWLNLFALGALWSALKLLESPSPVRFVGLGVWLALGLATHPRFAAWILAMLPFLLLNPVGRRWWRQPGFWLACAIGAVGLVPTIAFNVQHAFANLAFQMVERHPWRFAWEGFKFFPEQLLALGPAALALIGAALWSQRRDRDPALRLSISLALSHALIYALLAPFADRERLTLHWLLPSALALLCVVPRVLPRWSPALWGSSLVVGLLSSALLLGLLARGALGPPDARDGASKWLPENFIGWREAAGLARLIEPHLEPQTRLIADNFMLGAQLAFELDRPDSVWVLDHPLNAKHGRALQLRIWDRDQRAAAALAPLPRVLIAELSASKRDAVVDWMSGFCATLGPLKLMSDYALLADRKRFAVLAPTARGCELPAVGYVGVRHNTIEGWHWRNGVHVVSYQLWIDGRSVASLAPAPPTDSFVPILFTHALPLMAQRIELSARYASGGEVVIAQARR
jgi:4-amino-4-deoxy-L-arabinose transferase-like glycosyltransferase